MESITTFIVLLSHSLAISGFCSSHSFAVYLRVSFCIFAVLPSWPCGLMNCCGLKGTLVTRLIDVDLSGGVFEPDLGMWKIPGDRLEFKEEYCSGCKYELEKVDQE